MIHEPVSPEKLSVAIVIWEELVNHYKENMSRIRKEHKFTWFFRREYWKNESKYNIGFRALIVRRVQLQTAIKDKRERESV